MVCALVGVFCIFSETVFPLCLKVSHDTLGVSRGAPGIAPVSWWWHHSRRRGGGALAGSRELVVASLEETRVGGGITRADAGIALTF
jgi:hypothetical protein